MNLIVRSALVAACAASGAAFVARAQDAQPATAAAAPKPNILAKVVPYDTKALVAPSTLSDAAYRGRTVWLQRCAYCHDGVGQPSYKTLGPWIGAETVDLLTPDGIRAFVTTGTEVMPSFASALKPAQIDDLIAFLRTVPASSKPTEAQLAGRSSTEHSND